MDKILFLIKPDAIQCRQEIAIKMFLKDRNINFYDEKRMLLNELQAKIICKKYRGEEFFERLVNLLISSMSIAYIISGSNIINKMKEIVGDFNPMNAEEGSLRKSFLNSMFLFDGEDPIYNSVIFSEDRESAVRDIKIIYG